MRKLGLRHGLTPVCSRAPAMLSMLLLSLLVLSSCGRGASEPSAPQPGSSPPLNLGGQRVLVLPVQAPVGIPVQPGAVEAEVVYALLERDQRVHWITPDDIRRLVRRAPLFAGNPDALPADPMLHHGERRVVEPLAGELRRYSALADARLVLVPRLSQVADAQGGESMIWLSAALIDARSGDVAWRADLPTAAEVLLTRAGTAELAEAFARRLVSTGSPAALR